MNNDLKKILVEVACTDYKECFNNLEKRGFKEKIIVDFHQSTISTM